MYYFIVNEASGRGRAQWRTLWREMTAAGVPFRAWTTRCAGDATALARAASRLPDDEIRLVVVGGDGTINEVLNGIEDFERVALGVVPMGSGNDFARGLSISKNPRKALRAIFSASGERRIDLGQVTVDGRAPRRFGISAGVGLDAKVCELVNASPQKAWLNRFGLGHFSYTAKIFQVLGQLDGPSGEVIFHGVSEQRVSIESLVFLAAMNFVHEGGGVPMAPQASATDGRLSACLAESIRLRQVAALLPRLAIGRHGGRAGILLKDAPDIEVHLDAPAVVHADGEVFAQGRHVRFSALPSCLRVLV